MKLKLSSIKKIVAAGNAFNPEGKPRLFEIRVSPDFVNERLPKVTHFIEKKYSFASKVLAGESHAEAPSEPPAYQEVQDQSCVLPANGHDIGNYVARYGLANCQIQAVLKLNGRLDYDTMAKAVRLSIDEEPVFGCRFIESDPPYWKLREDIDSIQLCTLEETGSPDKSVMEFMESPLNMDKDPNVKIRLIRTGDSDTLCIKLNHACCDGAGAKEYFGLLSNIYSTLLLDNGGFIPRYRVAGRKDQDRLFKALRIEKPELLSNPDQLRPKSAWLFPWMPSWSEDARFEVCRLPESSVPVMKSYAENQGATVHDLILTAYYRAMFKSSYAPYGVPMDISSSLDLRRYLPDKKTGAIRNFSGGFITRIARIAGESFEDTLFRVMRSTKRIKEGNPGLQNAISGEKVEKKRFSKTRDKYKSSKTMIRRPLMSGCLCFPGLSNIGYISEPLLKFGENTVVDAFVLPPAIRAPGLLIVADSYNGVLTLTTGFYKSSVSQSHVKGLLNKIKDELMKGCSMQDEG